MIVLDGDHLTLAEVEKVAGGEEVSIAPACRERMEYSRSYLLRALASGRKIYGVNTGFGSFCEKEVSPQEAARLQRNLIISHAVGSGEPLSEAEVRSMLLLRANSLLKGYSGIRVELVERIVDFLNYSIVPWVPERGSVGASGDLIPLSHLALPLIGEGNVFYKGILHSAAKILHKFGLKPLELDYKEGLALINGTQTMTSVGGLSLLKAAELLKIADIAFALSAEALGARRDFLHSMVHFLRPHPGVQEVLENAALLLEGSASERKEYVQDAYSIRCVPQVHGAARDGIRFAWSVVERELNSVTDNPLIIADEELILSAGNFHGQPLALALDTAALALSYIGSISERRINRLLDPKLNRGLPPFLTPDGGLNSGLMLVQYLAASLVSSNKSLTLPSSADSIPTSADQEDLVSMGMNSALKLREIVKNTSTILACELLCATQALHFRPGIILGKGCQQAFTFLSLLVPKMEEDQYLYPLLEQIKASLENGSLLKKVESQGAFLK